jgi:hypothetical protein
VTTEPLGSAWRKSSYSNSSGGGCVEAACFVQFVAVRDSKCRDGASLRLAPSAWRAFVKKLS